MVTLRSQVRETPGPCVDVLSALLTSSRRGRGLALAHVQSLGVRCFLSRPLTTATLGAGLGLGPGEDEGLPLTETSG